MSTYLDFFVNQFLFFEEIVSRLLDPASFFIFILLPFLFFIILVKILKPKNLLYRFSLPLMVVSIILVFGFLLANKFSSGFFGMMALVGIIWTVIISAIVVSPFLYGIILYNEEKFLILLPPSFFNLILYFGSNRKLFNYTQMAGFAVIFIPIVSIALFFLGKFFNKYLHIYANNSNYVYSRSKSRIFKIILIIFSISWGLNAYPYFSAVKSNLIYVKQHDEDQSVLTKLNPPYLYKLETINDTTEWNKGYESGESPFVVKKFDFKKGLYENNQKILIDLRKDTIDNTRKLSPAGNMVMEFYNNGELGIFGENGLLKKYQFEFPKKYKYTYLGDWPLVASWSPSGQEILIYSCIQDICSDFRVLDLNGNITKLNFNLNLPHWVNNENLITKHNKTNDFSIVNIKNHTADNLDKSFSQYNILLPTPDLKMYAAFTNDGQLFFLNEKGKVIIKTMLKTNLKDSNMYTPYVQWSKDGNFLRVVGVLDSYIIYKDGKIYRPTFKPKKYDSEYVQGIWASS